MTRIESRSRVFTTKMTLEQRSLYSVLQPLCSEGALAPQFRCAQRKVALPTQKIENILSEDRTRYSPLQKLLHLSANQKAWTAEFRAVLDEPLKYNVEVTKIQGPVAHILCRSASAATRMRFKAPEILPLLNQLASFSQVSSFNLRVADDGGGSKQD